MCKTKLFLTNLLISAIFTPLVCAQQYDREYIETFAKQALVASLNEEKNKQVSVEVSPIDPRVVIKPCSSELHANIPQKLRSRNVNVQITCDDSIPWSIYLPARVRIKIPVVVATLAIDKGSLLTGDNIEVRWLDELKIRGEKMHNVNALIGAKANRNLMKGAAVTKRNICLVCKGDNVTIVAATSGLTLKTRGSSLSNGHIGDKVMVKNARSGKLVSATISGINEVEIIL